VEEAGRLLLAEHVDHPPDLAPAAEMDDVAEVAAAAGAKRGLGARIGAEAGDELGRIVKRGAVGEMDVTAQFPPGGSALL
jgi:hypothetical protein